MEVVAVIHKAAEICTSPGQNVPFRFGLAEHV